MPKENAHFIHAYLKKKKSPSHITAEEAAGIGILAVILGILLLFSCWYCKRRSGYKNLKNKNLYSGPRTILMGNYYRDETVLPLSKGSFLENSNISSVVPDAPPAYEFSAEQSLPPYTP